MANISTVVSVFPGKISEEKPLLPRHYEIPEAAPDNPQILHIDRGLNDVYVGEGRGTFGDKRSVIRVPVPSEEIARSIVDDFIDGFLAFGVVRPDAVPGLFWIEDHVPLHRVPPELLKQAVERQYNWFKNLVMVADDDWAKYQQHKVISDLQRKACLLLKLDKPWLFDNQVTAAMSECPVCFIKVNPKAIVCHNCKAILNEEAFKKLPARGL